MSQFSGFSLVDTDTIRSPAPGLVVRKDQVVCFRKPPGHKHSEQSNPSDMGQSGKSGQLSIAFLLGQPDSWVVPDNRVISDPRTFRFRTNRPLMVVQIGSRDR